MPLTIITQDILTVNTDALVISAKPNAEIGPGLDSDVYSLAGKEDLLNARSEIGTIKKGDAAITSGFSSDFKYILHTVVPTWYGGKKGEEAFLIRCYRQCLALATKKEITSIAFPLLGTGFNYIPKETALSIATNTIESWLHAHNSTLRVFLVLHPDHKFDKPNSSTETTSYTPYEHPEDFLRLRIKNQRSIADTISYNASNLSRLLSGEITTPRKNTILSLAICLANTKEERIRLITSYGYPYPSDERDLLIEDLISKGYTSFQRIHEYIYDKNPEWDLSKHK